MKDAVATMGNLLPEDAWGRDAVHVAVFSAYSTDALYPCQGVAVQNEEGGKDVRVRFALDGGVGIVDPFLPYKEVQPGERFWVYLYPRTITALSHRWSHPAFEQTDSTYTNPAAKLASENWLRNWIDSNDVPEYAALVDIAEKIADGEDHGKLIDNSEWAKGYDDDYSWSVYSDGLHISGKDAGGEIPPEFWTHMEIVIGRKIFKGKAPSYFSCSC